MWVFRWLICLVLLAQIASAENPARAKRKSGPSRTPYPNIVLITLDTTRADRMGFLGSKRGLTPNLDTLAHEGVVFTRAFSHVPLTPPSHATILTGTYPQFNHVNDFGVKLPDDVPDLPEILRAHGYHTGAFVSSLILDPIEGAAPGFDRGFDIYDAGFHTRRFGQDRYRTIERRADDVLAHALAWIDKHSQGPFFVWLHFYDAHDPYDPPEPFKSRYPSAPYDGEIAYVDSVVAKLVNQLRARGLYERAMMAVMADHGEALGEHGETAHGVFLYDETMHVPLLMKMTGERFAGKRIDSRVGLVDVAPTILQIAGLPVPSSMQGQSLLTMMQPPVGGAEAATADRPVYSESDYPRKAFGWSSLRAWRTSKYLFIEAPRSELYDQATDLHADHDISADAPAVTQTLKTQVDAFRQNTSSSTTAASQAADPRAQEKLSALGYVASGDDVSVREGIKDTGADPKDNVEIVNLLHDGMLDLEEMRYREAVSKLEQVLARDPIPVAYVQLGTALSWLKEYEKALPILRKAAEMRPDQMMTRYELGLALFETGDYEHSVPEFQAAIAKAPKWGALHFSLAAAYARMDRIADSQKELQTTVELDPSNFRGNLLLGKMLTFQGKPAAGLPNLKKAARLQPNSVEAHLFLAEAYERLGQKANAARERAEAERLKTAGGQ